MRRSHSLRQIIPLVIALQAGAASCSGAPASRSVAPPPDPGTLELGRKVFQANCASCHGSKGEGDGPEVRALRGHRPRNFVTDPFRYGREPEQVFDTLTTGIAGTPMPSWDSLSEEERWAVTHFVLSLRRGPAPGP